MDLPTVSQTIDSSARPMLFPQEGSGASRTTSLGKKTLRSSSIGEKVVFMSGDREGMRAVQKELKRELRMAKNSYKGRQESKLQQGHANEVWMGMKEMTGLNLSGPAVEGSQDQ